MNLSVIAWLSMYILYPNMLLESRCNNYIIASCPGPFPFPAFQCCMLNIQFLKSSSIIGERRLMLSQGCYCKNFQVQEWFKNRRKKDKLLKQRTQPKKRGRPWNSTSSTTATPAKKAKSATEMVTRSPLLVQKLISQSSQQHQQHHVEIDARSLLSQIQTPQQQAMIDEVANHLTSLTPPTAGHLLASSSDGGVGQMNLQQGTATASDDGSIDTVAIAGHELQVASSIELGM